MKIGLTNSKRLVKTDVIRMAQKPTDALLNALRAGFGAPVPWFRFCAAAVMQLAFQNINDQLCASFRRVWHVIKTAFSRQCQKYEFLS